MNSYLAPRMPSFFVAKLRNSTLLRAHCASNLNILHHHLLRPDLTRGSLAIATELRAFIEGRDGFISIERFQSLVDEEKVLSLSFWRDEAAISSWRNIDQHRAAQSAGRNGIISSYRLRVATVIRDYDMKNRGAAPDDSKNYHS